jgi:hypothetical protein
VDKRYETKSRLDSFDMKNYDYKSVVFNYAYFSKQAQDRLRAIKDMYHSHDDNDRQATNQTQTSRSKLHTSVRALPSPYVHVVVVCTETMVLTQEGWIRP